MSEFLSPPLNTVKNLNNESLKISRWIFINASPPPLLLSSSLTAIYSDHEPSETSPRDPGAYTRGSTDLPTCWDRASRHAALCNCPGSPEKDVITFAKIRGCSPTFCRERRKNGRGVTERKANENRDVILSIPRNIESLQCEKKNRLTLYKY